MDTRFQMTLQELDCLMAWQKWESLSRIRDKDMAKYWNRMYFLEQHLKW